MKPSPFLALPAAAIFSLSVGLLASAPAAAHGSHRHAPRVHFGFVFGAPVYPFPQPRYYYPAPIMGPSSPPVYIEQGQPSPADSASYWYFCAESDAYYPYVKHCPGGWQRVTPQPPPG